MTSPTARAGGNLVFCRLPGGPRTEPPVSNDEFLRSMLQVGCWLRVLATYPHVAPECKHTHLQQLASAAAVYQNLALAIEDQVALLAATLALAKKPDLLVADLLGMIRIENKEVTADFTYEKVRDDLVHGPKKGNFVSVNGNALIQSLADLARAPRGARGTPSGKIRLVEELGIPWKHSPIPEWVLADEHEEWRNLPRIMHWHIVEFLSHRGIREVLKAHNKLKHGPQVVTTTLAAAAAKRGIASDTIDAPIPICEERLRLLSKGARTQGDVEPKDDYTAPFLVHESLESLFFGKILGIAAASSTLVKWLLRAHYQVTDSPPKHTEPLKTIYGESHRRGFATADYHWPPARGA